jgi:hypothetical protein
MDVDLLLDELDAGKRDAEGLLRGVEVLSGGLVEAGLFDAQFIRLLLVGRPGAASGVVGGHAEGRLAGLVDGDLRGGDDDAVLVDDGEGYGVGICLRSGGMLNRAGYLPRRDGSAADEECGERGGDCGNSTLRTWHQASIQPVRWTQNKRDAGPGFRWWDAIFTRLGSDGGLVMNPIRLGDHRGRRSGAISLARLGIRGYRYYNWQYPRVRVSAEARQTDKSA